MPNGDDVGAMYRDCRLRVGELLDAATPYEALTPVAACPGWRVWGDLSTEAAVRGFVQERPFVAFRPVAVRAADHTVEAR